MRASHIPLRLATTMSVQDLNNNDFLLSLLAAVIQQTQQQQQQQQQLQEQLQEQQQQVWSAALAAAQSQLAAAAAAAAVAGHSPVPFTVSSNASSPPCPLGASGHQAHPMQQQQQQQQQQLQLQQQLQHHMQQQHQHQHHHQTHHPQHLPQPQFSNASSPCPLGTNGQHPHLGQCPSSSLLAKLNAVTSRPQAHLPTHSLDNNMIDLLEALYAINDNPEMGAIEMISKRISVPCDLIADWFDKKRMELNPFAGPRSPPCAKKREGGRVVTFSEYQRSLLEGIFNENNYLHPQEYEELSKLIQVPSRNIKIWFKNRRSKQRLSGGSQK